MQDVPLHQPSIPEPTQLQ